MSTEAREVPTTRDIIATALQDNWERNGVSHEQGSDAVVAALTAAGKAIVDVHDGPDGFLAALEAMSPISESSEEWEYNIRGHNSGELMLNAWVSEEEARGWLDSRFNRVVVRRHPAGPPEVAP